MRKGNCRVIFQGVPRISGRRVSRAGDAFAAIVSQSFGCRSPEFFTARLYLPGRFFSPAYRLMIVWPTSSWLALIAFL
jgi:hypothetical protein